MLTNNLIDPLIQNRANTSVRWLGSDSVLNYKEIVDKFPNLYSRYDIEYKFNSHGFRCDEFDIPSEIPIVFLGCSITEGIGIRQNETWSYLLLEKIKQKTNKYIPYWNLSLGGTGIDTQARNLYFLTNILNKKTKFVFSLMPQPYRREYKVESNEYRNWLPNWLRDDAPLNTHINPIFSDSNFSIHQSERSLMTIDTLCRQNDAKMCCTFWDNTLLTKEKTLIDSFPLIDLFSINLRINAFRPNIARDGLHPGPLYHQKLSEVYWNHIEKYFVTT